MLVMNQKGLQGNPILIALVPSYNHAELKESVLGGGDIYMYAYGAHCSTKCKFPRICEPFLFSVYLMSFVLNQNIELYF